MSSSSTIYNAIKPLVPGSIKHKVKSALQERTLGRALRKLKNITTGAVPSREILEELQKGWSNEGMAAQEEYLEAVARYAMDAKGPILECGSGLTTLLLGVIAGSRGVDVWTLEHSPDWHLRVSDTLKRNGISGVNNCLVKLKDYGEFTWYDTPLSTMPGSFSLVVCDGPPGTTKGGRYGLIPVFKDRLPRGTTILLDDADREAESRAMAQWSAEMKISTTLHDESRGKFAVITVLGNE